MKSFDKDLKKYSKKIKLKISERRELRERILSYMEYHPLPKQGNAIEMPEDSILSEAYTKLRISSVQLKISGAFFVLLLIFIPIFAERSVPGDVLYALKTGVNEKIQAQLANSPYEKIEFETKLMERRITEARILASEGKLTEEAKDKFEITVKEHAQAVRDELTELKTQDADGAAFAEIAFNSSLDVQSTMLYATENDSGETSLDELLIVVNDARDETLLEQEDNKPSYVGLVAQVELHTTRAYELFEIVKETAVDEEIVDIERRLSDINRLFTEAKESAVTDENKSISDSAHILGLIQKLILFMTNIEVREVVTLESLVPVILNLEERVNFVEKEVKSIEELRAEVLQRIEILKKGGLVEKVNGGIVKINELMAKIQIALEIEDVNLSEVTLAEARALITDLDAMTMSEIAESQESVGLEKKQKSFNKELMGEVLVDPEEQIEQSRLEQEDNDEIDDDGVENIEPSSLEDVTEEVVGPEAQVKPIGR